MSASCQKQTFLVNDWPNRRQPDQYLDFGSREPIPLSPVHQLAARRSYGLISVFSDSGMLLCVDSLVA
jgi:hypothetical protein